MRKLERLGIKVLLFVIISGLINFYVLSRIFSLFDFTKGPWFIALCIFASISYLFGAELLRKFNNNTIKGISAIFSIWFGVSFIFLWTFGLFDIVNFVIPMNFEKVGLVIFTIDLLLIIYSIYNATTFSVRTIRVESEKINKAFKIVQLSDLHIGAAHKDDFLEKTVNRVNALNPDFVVITGDLLDGVHPYRGEEFTCLNKINSPVFFTLGNHEQFIDIDEVYSLLRHNHMTFLRNRSITHDGLQIIGIDDAFSKHKFIEDFKKIVVDKNKFSILLYHRPNVFNEVSKEDIDLMLSGHTHGGQIFPLNIIMSFFDGPVEGIHRKNDTVIYVSNGTGWWGPPMRLGSRNEITVIELIPLKQQNSENKDFATEHSSSGSSEATQKNIKVRKRTKIAHAIKHKKAKIKHKLLIKSKKPVKNAKVISLKRGKKALKASSEEDLKMHIMHKNIKKDHKKQKHSEINKNKK